MVVDLTDATGLKPGKQDIIIEGSVGLQNPDNRYQFNNINWAMAQRAIADDYQRLIWGPAELLNGRMASE